MMMIVDSAKLVVKSPAVVLINLLGTALLAAGAVYWLSPSVDVASGLRLSWAILLGLVLLVGWWWLDSGSNAYFYRAARGDKSVKVAYTQGLKRALLFALLAAAWLGVWWLLDELHEPANQYASYLYSKMSAANRGRAGYEGIQSAFVLLLDIAQWYLLPIV